MCYSAMVWSEYKSYVRKWGADIDVREYVRLYWDHAQSPFLRPKGMDLGFAHPTEDWHRKIKEIVDARGAAETSKLEQEMFKQAKRLADAERTLQTKTTKKALEDQRISTNKIAGAKAKLADLKRTEPKPQDSRIFPGWYVPVMVWE